MWHIKNGILIWPEINHQSKQTSTTRTLIKSIHIRLSLRTCIYHTLKKNTEKHKLVLNSPFIVAHTNFPVEITHSHFGHTPILLTIVSEWLFLMMFREKKSKKGRKPTNKSNTRRMRKAQTREYAVTRRICQTPSLIFSIYL